MRILFLGHQPIGQRCLQALIDVGADVGLIVGHEGKDSLASIAEQHNITFQVQDKAPTTWQWPNDKESFEWIVSVYFRYLVPDHLLKAPKGAMNIHCSLLPAYRGCAPINWALANGETRVGVTFHDMVTTADAGDIVEQISIDILPDQQAGDIMDILAEYAAEIIKRQYVLVQNNQVKRKPQPLGDYKIYPRRTHKDGFIDWTWSAERIHNLVRAVNPAERYGGAFTSGGFHILESRLASGDIPVGYKRFPCNNGEWIDIRLCPSCDTCIRVFSQLDAIKA